MSTATGAKSGGRVAGTPNRPKPGAVAAPESQLAATGAKLPPYKLARVDRLVEYPNNARQHSPAQVDMLARMITEYGWTNPILVDGARGVIAGHGRLLAARKLGMDVVPTIELRHLTDAQKRAYVIADNQSALTASWDDDLLRMELGALRDDGFDMALTGFDLPDLAALFGPEPGATDPDDAPPVQAVAVSRLGDVWTLGRHRLVCGDCTDAGVVETALAGVRPHLMVTDPPYGVSYDAGWRNKRVKVDFAAKRAVGGVGNDDLADWHESWELFSGSVAYVWCASMFSDAAIASLESSGFERRSQIIWAKQHFILGRGHYHWQHEPCWYVVRKGSTGNWNGDRTQSTVWEIKSQIGYESARPDNKDKATGHSTQKPVECMRRPIENNSSAGQAVYDPFVGSGTTIIAAEMTGRACHAIEISPQYVDVAIRRWQAFTALDATHADGRTFAAHAAERTPA